jgi:hypothetical protein
MFYWRFPLVLPIVKRLLIILLDFDIYSAIKDKAVAAGNQVNKSCHHINPPAALFSRVKRESKQNETDQKHP